jgi:hypothetical protein
MGVSGANNEMLIFRSEMATENAAEILVEAFLQDFDTAGEFDSSEDLPR